MDLILDIGNTRIKYHLFSSGKRMLGDTLESLEGLEEKLLGEYSSLQDMIYADVRGKYSHNELCTLFPNLKVHLVKSLPGFPFVSNYATPETLGEDRLALVAAATKHYPHCNCLIIDAGTCITYDLITAEENYLGGAISPGLSMRFKSLSHFTSKLPEVKEAVVPPLWGNTTETSIQAGVIQGIIHELDGQINAYKARFPSLTVILTGGDAHYLSKSVKNTIFAQPNFLAEGLNHLLDYNKN